MRKLNALLFLTILLWIIFPLATTATGETSMPLIDIPDAIAEYLPEDVLAQGTDTLLGSFSLSFFWKTGWRILVAAMPGSIKMFALILGLLLMAACLRALRETIAMPALQTVLELISMSCVCAAVFSVTEGLFAFARNFITGMSAFLTVLTPTMAGLMIAGGNTTSAAVLSCVMTVTLGMLEKICSGVLFTLIRISFAVCAVGAVFGSTGVSSILPLIKKWIAYIFGFVTFCLSALITFQTILAKSADSVAIKGVKFVVGAFVPIVGGSVNEAIATVAGGLKSIRAATGTVGAIVVILIAAVPLCGILAHKLFLELLAASASILGISAEGKFIADVASFFGYVAAILAISAVFFVLVISLMASISAA